MKVSKKSLFLLTLTPIAVGGIAIASTSCSQTITTYNGRLVTTDFASKKYSELSSINNSLESLVYGSNYNNGNYVFVYGTTADSGFRSFLYGPNGNDGSGNDKNYELNFSSSPFMKSFFGDNSLGKGDLLNYSISLILYVDVAPYNGNAGADYNGLDGINSPVDRFTIDEVLAQANGDIANKYDAKTLPEEYRYKVNTFKRADQSAKTYREFLAYLKSIRPNGSFADASGMIAFKKDAIPQKLDALDTSYSTLVDFYQKGITTNPTPPDNGGGDNGGEGNGGDTGGGDTGGGDTGGDQEQQTTMSINNQHSIYAESTKKF